MVVLKVVLPALSVPVPSEVVPSRNVTVPVGVPAAVLLTVAIKVTLAPGAEGFCEDTTLVDEDAFATAFTVCVRTAEVLAA